MGGAAKRRGGGSEVFLSQANTTNVQYRIHVHGLWNSTAF